MSSSLSSVLQERLDRIDGARSLVVSTLDGVELCAGKSSSSPLLLIALLFYDQVMCPPHSL